MSQIFKTDDIYVSQLPMQNINVENGRIIRTGGASDWNDLENKPFETIGENLKVVDGVLEVDTAPNVEQDNTKPITSAAVYTEVGNINALLALI